MYILVIKDKEKRKMIKNTLSYQHLMVKLGRNNVSENQKLITLNKIIRIITLFFCLI